MGKDQPHNLIDDVIHQRTRLAIMATLAGLENLDFNDLKTQLGLTDGNLSTHLAALERADSSLFISSLGIYWVSGASSLDGLDSAVSLASGCRVVPWRFRDSCFR